MSEAVRHPDTDDARRVRQAPGVLRAFNDAGVLAPADVHVARRLAALGDEPDEAVVLGAALAARAPRLGHVCVDVATARDTVTADSDEPVDTQVLPWPDADDWLARLAGSALVADADAGDRPLRLEGTRLYLDRYWREECQVAADLLARAGRPSRTVDREVLAEGLTRLFGDDGADQRLAAAAAVLRRLAVVTGGPGTGKTTTVARVLALLFEQVGVDGVPPRVALAAPTGKAALRLEEAVHDEAAGLDVDAPVRDRLLGLSGTTLHRLLGWRPGSRSRFRHHRGNRLPHDVVVVDETSMVSLSLMAKLVEAVRGDAQLVLVGDHEQLASVEAGAVLGDVVGPAAGGLRMQPPTRKALAALTGAEVAAGDPPGSTAIGDGIVVLHRVHRFGSGIAEVAEAVQRGDADAVVDALRAGRDGVAWQAGDPAADHAQADLEPVRRQLVDAGRRVADAAARGDAHAALAALGEVRLLCAHRRGPYGVTRWAATVQGWLAAAVDGYGAGGRWYVGQPLLVTENDYGLRLYNGDVGVVVAGADGRLQAAFERRGTILTVSPSRLAAVETVHAMTVHKSQGSQFDAAAVVLPEATSPLLTRQLLYTALTRARRRLTVVGTEAALRAAVTRPIARASGLQGRLWPQAGAGDGP